MTIRAGKTAIIELQAANEMHPLSVLVALNRFARMYLSMGV